MEVMGLVLEFVQVLKIILRWFRCHMIDTVIAIVHHRLKGLEDGRKRVKEREGRTEQIEARGTSVSGP